MPYCCTIGFTCELIKASLYKGGFDTLEIEGLYNTLFQIRMHSFVIT